jgi:hypothetical protein
MPAVTDEKGASTLSRAEVEATLAAFTPADWQRAKVIAAGFCAGITGLACDDLLQEAVTKLLEGARTWPAGVHPLVVLKNVMHSVASNARKHNAASPIDEAVQLDPVETDEDTKTPAVQGKVTVTPEDKFSGKQQIIDLYAALGGDQDLELLVLVWADRLRGKDAQDELGWDEKKYDAERKRLTRRLQKLDPDRSPK